MCCFSQPVASVSNTRILARASVGPRQLLVYAMKLAAPTELAMVLPLPVPPGSPDDALRFVDLSAYPKLFDDLDRAFPEPVSRALGYGGPVPGFAPAPQLAVHAVGAFEASFVPAVADFARLDPRFALPPQVWRELPAYADFGFAVFKLAASARAAEVHPMAFEFPRRDARALFFPTVHVHDGGVHASARFDHSLYLQVDPSKVFADPAWRRSDRVVGFYVDRQRAAGVVDELAVAYRLQLRGAAPNRDVYAALPA